MTKALPLLLATLLFVLPTPSIEVLLAKLVAISLLWKENTLKGEHRAWYAFAFFIIVLVTGLVPILHLWNPLVVPSILFTIIVVVRRRWFEGQHWLLQGHTTKESWFLAALTIPLSALALIGWAYLNKPDLSVYADMIPGTGIAIVFAAAIIFSILNALAEEIAFRGILWRALEDTGLTSMMVLVFQAIGFGILHFKGVPSGLSGMGLATVYGLALGGIRYLSKGVLMPIIVHVFADLTIFMIMMHLAGRW